MPATGPVAERAIVPTVAVFIHFRKSNIVPGNISSKTQMVFSSFVWTMFAITPACPQTISVDLSYRIRCEDYRAYPSNDQIRGFLNAHGFKLLDKKNLTDSGGSEKFLLRDLWALDTQDRVLTFLQLPIGTDDIIVGLRSPPPTHRDEAFEEELLSFGRDFADCRLVEIARHDNKADVRSMHYQIVNMLKSWMKRRDDINRL